MDEVKNEPGFQVYELAPFAVSVADSAKQIVFVAGEILIVGLFTTNSIVELEEHPARFVPVTVKTVVVNGDAVIDELIIFPVNHVYVKAPLAVMVDEFP